MFNINSGYGKEYSSIVKPKGTGKVFVVGDSNAKNLDMIRSIFGPDPDGVTRFFSTITAALEKCTASAMDTIYVLPGYSQTVTAAIDINVAGVSVVGIGSGSLVPKITGNGTIDAINISAANVTIDNIQFGAPSTDAQTSFINVNASGATIKNIYGIGSTTSKNVVDCITVTANASDLVIDGVTLFNSVVPVNSFLSLEGAASRVTIKNFLAFGDVDTAGIIDAAKIDYLVMENVKVAVVGTTKPAITLDSNPEGIATNCYFAGTSTTLATNAALGNLMRLFNIFVTEETNGSAQGAQIPAVDAD